MKGYEQMARDALQRIDALRAARRKKIKAGVLSVSCICLAAVLSVGVVFLTRKAPSSAVITETVITESKNESIVQAENTINNEEANAKPNVVQTGKNGESAKKAASKTNNKSSQGKERSSTGTTGTGQTAGTNACMLYNEPTFYTQKAFNAWLSTGAGLEEQWKKFLNYFNQPTEITYYFPRLNKLPACFSLQAIRFHELSGNTGVELACKDEKITEKPALPYSLHIMGLAKEHNVEDDSSYFNEAKKNYEAKETGVEKRTKNGNDYYITYVANAVVEPHYQIDWQQYGITFCATLYGHENQMDQILEALNMQPVTVKIEK